MSDQDQVVSLQRNTSAVIAQQQLAQATSQIQYHSDGHALILGALTEALAAAELFDANGATVVVIDPQLTQVEKRLTDTGLAVFTVPELSLTGYLGAFKAKVPALAEQASDFDLAVSVYRESGCFDVVLDLSSEPVMPYFLPPFGYRHCQSAEQTAETVDELKQMTGEFEKPRYFNYNADICAHSRSQLAGCNRCVDVCATGAITSVGEGVTVDPFLCQGCGSCATVCPSGAMSYAYPKPSNAIDRARVSMAESEATAILLYSETHEELVEAVTLHAEIKALQVEEVTAFGADFWLAMLAGRASRIFLLNDADPDDPGLQAVREQAALVHDLLLGLGVEEQPIVIMGSDVLQGAAAEKSSLLHPESWRDSVLSSLKPADFATHNDKRQTLRLALDVLSEQLNPANDVVQLKKGAPFGRINVDENACTLCMACVSTCPAKALLDGQDTPALRLVEANCLQCGLCETACPESAISLQPQYTWDSISARQVETLNEEEPFHCLVCHTPFTTRAMIDTMSAKLAGHWMFEDPKALRRLKMCGDCRVRDMFEEDRQGINVHNDS